MNKLLTFYIKNVKNRINTNSNSLNKLRSMYTSHKDAGTQIKKIKPDGIFLLLIPIGTFALGTWQVQRRKWKLGLVKELESKTTQPPIPFPENVHELEHLEYRKVEIYGEFDHSQEVYLGPRSLLVMGDYSEKGGGLISSSQSGYNVITPFILANNNLKILVNRGWVPRKQLNPSHRQSGQISGNIKLTATVRKQEERAPLMPENMNNSKKFAYRDVMKMAQMTDSAPIYVDAIETISGGPKGGQTRVTLRNEHMSYIITWYSLSLATSFLWFRKFIMNKPLM